METTATSPAVTTANRHGTTRMRRQGGGGGQLTRTPFPATPLIILKKQLTPASLRPAADKNQTK